MGLDQYLYKRKNNKAESESDNIEIGYWRKYSDLQGFMQKAIEAIDEGEHVYYNSW